MLPERPVSQLRSRLLPLSFLVLVLFFFLIHFIVVCICFGNITYLVFFFPCFFISSFIFIFILFQSCISGSSSSLTFFWSGLVLFNPSRFFPCHFFFLVLPYLLLHLLLLLLLCGEVRECNSLPLMLPDMDSQVGKYYLLFITCRAVYGSDKPKSRCIIHW